MAHDVRERAARPPVRAATARAATARAPVPWPAAAQATLHCLIGCAIGEVLGMVIGTAAGLPSATTVTLSVLLAFAFGYGLTMHGMMRAGVGLRAAFVVALAADTVSIAVMELLDNAVMLAVPGAMAAGLDSALFWASLAGSLAVAFVLTTPVNRFMIARGRGHAVLHQYHQARRADSTAGKLGGNEMHTYHTHYDVSVVGDYLEVPGLGFLPVNAFVVHAAQPVVVDTGLGLPDRDFVAALAEVIDPADVRWIWLTHPDRDHTGGLFALLDAAPKARVVTTFLGVGIMSCERPLPIDRVYLLNPGQSLDVGDRRLTGFRPPLFDNPATVGILDTSTGVCLSSDCFGAPLRTAELASAPDAAAAGPAELRAGQLLWATVDSPWVHTVDQAKYAASFRILRNFSPSAVLSTHLPPVTHDARSLFRTLLDAPQADVFIGPDQAALEALLREFEPASP